MSSIYMIRTQTSMKDSPTWRPIEGNHDSSVPIRKTDPAYMAYRRSYLYTSAKGAFRS